TRGQGIDQASIKLFIDSLDIPDEAKNLLLNMSPASYTGCAEFLAKDIINHA
ncbi:MAG: adenylosuccinate lyase, partial [Cycloclasticus sp.]